MAAEDSRDEIVTEWESLGLFVENDSPFFGFCHTADDADDVVQEYSYTTSASFSAIRATKDFGLFDLTGD